MREPHYRCLKCATTQGVLVLTITQPLLLDDDIVDVLQDELTAVVNQHQPRKVVLNLQNVRALASVAFRPVIALHQRLQELNGRLLLCGLTNSVAEVFHITGLLSDDTAGAPPFAAESNLDAAVARLAQAPDQGA